jgi:hypothetical protein
MVWEALRSKLRERLQESKRTRVHACAPPTPVCTCTTEQLPGEPAELSPVILRDPKCVFHSGYRDPDERCRWCGERIVQPIDTEAARI